MVESYNKALAAAVRFFEKSVKEGADTEQLLTLGDSVRSAKQEVADCEKRAAGFTKRIEFAEWEAKSVELTAATSIIHEAHKAAVASVRDVLDRFGATQVNSVSVLSGDGVGGTKAIGDRIPKQPGKGGTRKASNGGGGFTSHGARTVAGVEYPSTNAAYKTLRGAADGIAPNDVTPANNKSAMAWLERMFPGQVS